MFEAINVFTPNKEIRLALPDDGVVSCVTIPRHVYTNDLATAFRDTSVRKQVSVDAPRCHLEVDGVRCLGVPEMLPDSLLPLCTQAIMGLPVELLHKTFGCVAEVEKHSPLKVCLTSTGDVVAHKELCIFDGTKAVPVHVSVITMEGDSDVFIIFNASI